MEKILFEIIKIKRGYKMNFIKITHSEKLEQIINVDNIIELIKGEDFENGKIFTSYTVVMKNFGPVKITENVYKQIKKQIGF